MEPVHGHPLLLAQGPPRALSLLFSSADSHSSGDARLAEAIPPKTALTRIVEALDSAGDAADKAYTDRNLAGKAHVRATARRVLAALAGGDVRRINVRRTNVG